MRTETTLIQVHTGEKLTSSLRNLEAASFAQQHVAGGHPHILEDYLEQSTVNCFVERMRLLSGSGEAIARICSNSRLVTCVSKRPGAANARDGSISTGCHLGVIVLVTKDRHGP